MTYMAALSEDDARERLSTLLSYDVPGAFVTKAQRVPEYFLAVAGAHAVPVLRSGKSTKDFYRRIKPYLEVALAP